MKKRIIGERIYLKELEPDDISEEYVKWSQDLIVTQFLEARNLTKKELSDYIIEGKKTNSFVLFGVFLNENDKHIGNLKLGPFYHKHKTSDLVIVIGDRNYWGQGYAREAIELGNRLAFEEYDIRKLWGDIYSNNIGSIKTYTRAGWVIEAIFEGHYLLEEKTLDSVCVACFNPKYFDIDKIREKFKHNLKIINGV